MAADKLQLTQQLLTIAADAFDSTELEMVGYFFRGEAPASPAASGGGNKKVLFDLLLRADREGRLLDLANRLAREKPNCAELQRVVDDLRQILAPQDGGGATAGLKTPTAISAELPGSVATSPVIKSTLEAVVPPLTAAPPSPPAPGPGTPASPSAPRKPRAATGGVSVFFGTATPDARGQADRKAVIDSVRQIKQWPVRVLSAPEIFVSFAWGDDQTDAGIQRQQAVDELCDQLEEQGFLVRRDSQEIRFGGVISEYMQRLGRSDRVLVILSEKYLRSISCMTELHAIYKRSQGEQVEFLQRVIPVALKDARFSTPEERADHADHWQARMEGLEKRWKSLGKQDLQLLHAMRGWSLDIGDMLAFLNDTLAPRRLEEIRQADR
ncbi:MAG: toll/interleukin-1 receptor domain-containing protein, partial [Planctomycetaceae bacterium]